MPYDSKAVANYLLGLAEKQGTPLTPMMLQKLVYFAHGWHLALADKPLVDEPVQAWKYGPVIDSLYHAFRGFGDRPITKMASDVRAEPGSGEIVKFEPTLDDEKASRDLDIAKAIINRVYKLYGGFSGLQLSAMTHREGTPWDQVQKKYPKGLPRTVTIPGDTIKRYFQARLDEQPKL